MENPIFLSEQSGKSFVYYHTHRVYKENLEEAITSKKSIELDISFDEKGVFYEKGAYYIGHPVTFYTEFGKEFHNNMLLEEAIKILEANSDIFVVLDCKDIRAFIKIEEIIKRLGAHRCLFHAFIKEWSFRPFESDIEVEPHWKEEEIPLEEVLRFKERNKIPIIGACKGFSEKRLRDRNVVNQIIDSVKGRDIDSISLYMPGTILPPLDLARQLSQAGFLNWINIDKIEGVDLSGITYIGMTDVLERASDFKS